MTGLDSYWAAIDAQLAQARTATTAADVLRIFAAPGHNSPGFSGATGEELSGALDAAGWTWAWSRANYHWAMFAPDGTSITYVEGDLYPGTGAG